jgi:hypothetical protein
MSPCFSGLESKPSNKPARRAARAGLRPTPYAKNQHEAISKQEKIELFTFSNVSHIINNLIFVPNVVLQHPVARHLLIPML